MGLRIIRVPHFVIVSSLIQKSRLVSKAVKVCKCIQFFQHFKRMLLSPALCGMPFFLQQFQDFRAHSFQRLTLAPVIPADFFSVFIIKVHKEAVADSDGHLAGMNPDASLFLFHTDRCRSRLIPFDCLGMCPFVSSAIKNIDNIGRHYLDPPFFSLKIKQDFLPPDFISRQFPQPHETAPYILYLGYSRDTYKPYDCPSFFLFVIFSQD